MKRLIDILLTLAMLLSLCVPAMATESHTITSQVYPYYLIGEENAKEMTLYFLEGVTDLPYMEARDLCEMLNYMIGDQELGVSYTMETNRLA